jgi:hypothetical protein
VKKIQLEYILAVSPPTKMAREIKTLTHGSFILDTINAP